MQKRIIITLFILSFLIFTKAQNLSLQQLIEIKNIKVGDTIEKKVDNYLLDENWILKERKKPNSKSLKGVSKYKDQNNDYPETATLEHYYSLTTKNTRVEISSIESQTKFEDYINQLINFEAKLIFKEEKDGLLTQVGSKDDIIVILKLGEIEWAFGYETIRSIQIMSKDDYNTNFAENF